MVISESDRGSTAGAVEREKTVVMQTYYLCAKDYFEYVKENDDK